MKKLTLCAALIVAAWNLSPVSALAGELDGYATFYTPEDISVTVEQILSFGRVVRPGSSSTLRIQPDGGLTLTDASLQLLDGQVNGQYLIAGDSARDMFITVDKDVSTYASGCDVSGLTNFTLSQNINSIYNGSGTLKVGAELTIAPDVAASGNCYFTLTVIY